MICLQRIDGIFRNTGYPVYNTTLEMLFEMAAVDPVVHLI